MISGSLPAFQNFNFRTAAMACLFLFAGALAQELKAQITTPSDNSVPATGPGLIIYNNNSFDVTDTPFAFRATSQAASGQSATNNFEFINTVDCDFTLTNTVPNASWTRVIDLLSAGGMGLNVDSGSSADVLGSFQSTLQANGIFDNGLTLLSVRSQGGSGSNTGNRNGFAGGNAGSAVVYNYGYMSAGSNSSYLQGGTGFRGVEASSQGGNAGDDPAGDDGGNGGVAVASLNGGNLSLWWNATNSSGVANIDGLVAESIGGNGGSVQNYTDVEGKDGGNGGNAAAANAYVSFGSQINMTVTGSSPTTQQISGAAVLAQSIGGNGGNAYDGDSDNPSYAGAGGNAALGSSTGVYVETSSISVSGDYLGAILAQNIGGKGGSGLADQDHSVSGNGGWTGDVSVTFDDDLVSAPIVVSTNGKYAHTVQAGAQGGQGGGPSSGAYNSELIDSTGGNGGNGGSTGEVDVVVTDRVQLSTAGDNSLGIYAYTAGGNGGYGIGVSNLGDHGNPGNGGNGGIAGDVDVELRAGSSLVTTGERSYGIFAQASGGNGQGGGSLKGLDIEIFDDNPAGTGGTGGSTGKVEVEVGGTIQTSGDHSSAVVAMNLSGNGGEGGDGEQSAVDGAPGNGGSVGETIVNNSGIITTSGDSSLGILAMASSGGGGASGFTSDIFHSTTRSGGAAGSVGEMTLENSGTIQTSGDFSYGILGLSLGGGGGAAGEASGVTALTGSGGPSANGGTISLDQSGTIETAGKFSFGAILLSIGGGGGDGGASTGILAVGGGSGSNGGSGGEIDGTLGGNISTTGDNSTGILAVSIGGGGGNAGDATANSAEIAMAIGGSGGDGGNGGKVNLTATGSIIASGNASSGLHAMSVGGGGGTGGSAYAMEVGVEIGGGVSVGGTGGDGGNGSTVYVTADGANIQTGEMDSSNPPPTNFYASDAIGILAQSIGGGGGRGGSSFAQAVAIAEPTLDGTEVAASLAFSVGGNGGDGGNAAGAGVGSNSTVGTFVDYKGASSMLTQGQGSHGILAQGIGGGGGQGGDSTAMASTMEYTRGEWRADPKGSTYSLSVAVNLGGGTGGAAGSGGLVQVEVGDSITGEQSIIETYGDYSNGIMAQSIGGGGGNAGIGSNSTAGYGASKSISANINLGAKGGEGGNGWIATADVQAGSQVSTYGSGSHAVVAQSIGGGGGTSQGGTISLSGEYTFSYIDGDDAPHFSQIAPKGTLQVNLGITGGDGGSGNEAKVVVDGKVSTAGDDSAAVVVQSIGGGGGIGGASGADASPDNPVIVGLGGLRGAITAGIEGYTNVQSESRVSVGSSAAGFAGNGGQATTELSGEISTQGDWSYGILAQSIGGGGGKGGSSLASGLPVTTQVDMRVGGAGAQGNGGEVLTTLSGGTIVTGNNSGSGHGAYGIVMQSIGGGGGIAVDGSDSVTGVARVGAYDFSSGVGADVELDGNGSVETLGNEAHAVVMQSIGSGGGIIGVGSSAATASPNSVNANIGNQLAAEGFGGDVTIDSSLVASTHGANAYGVLAQSIGGGGGLAAVASNNTIIGNATLPEFAALSFGGAVELNLNAGSDISTQGINSHGIVAQSIGGGGGIAGYNSNAGSFQAGNVINSSNQSYGPGGLVEVTLTDSFVTTQGDGAFGMLLQSIGQGGGIWVTDGVTHMGSTAGSGGGIGGAIQANVTGSQLVAHGDNAIALFAQSTSGNGGGSKIAVNVRDIGGAITATGANSTAVYFNGGNSTNTLDVYTGGEVIGPVAAHQDSGGTLNVRNDGKLTGSVTGTIENIYNAGEFRTGATVNGNVITGQSDTGGNSQITYTGSLIIGTADNSTDSTHFTGSLSFYGGDISFYVASEMAYSNFTVDGNFNLGAETVIVNVDFASFMAEDTQLDLFTALSGTSTSPGGMFEIHLTGAYEGILSQMNSYSAEINGQEIMWTVNEGGNNKGQLKFTGEVVPEPSTVILFFLGGVAIFFQLRRRAARER